MRRRHPRTLGRTQPGTLPLDRRQHRRTRRQAQAVHCRLRGGDQAQRIRLREVEGKRAAPGQPAEDLQGVPPQGRAERQGHEGARADAPRRTPVAQALRMGQSGSRPVGDAILPRVRRVRRTGFHGRVVRRNDRQTPRRHPRRDRQLRLRGSQHGRTASRMRMGLRPCTTRRS